MDRKRRILIVDDEKEIVQLHGGTVACESENEIIRFVVELP